MYIHLGLLNCHWRANVEMSRTVTPSGVETACHAGHCPKLNCIQSIWGTGQEW